MYKKIQTMLGVAIAAAVLQTALAQAGNPCYDCEPNSGRHFGKHFGKHHGKHHGNHSRTPHVNHYLKPKQRAERYNWHANYAHSAYGQPIALVVPPTANMQTTWSWGAPSAHFSRIDHQFGRDYPGPGPFGGGFNNTPQWPQSTHQFGVYYVRGPWYPTQR